MRKLIIVALALVALVSGCSKDDSFLPEFKKVDIKADNGYCPDPGYPCQVRPKPPTQPKPPGDGGGGGGGGW